MDVVAVAESLADDLLFPAALATDAADTVPAELLDALAAAGLYGLGAPEGPEADFAAVCGAVEALASGCLTTTFVWAQHLGAVRAAAASSNDAVRGWAGPLARGERRAGLALGGALPRATLVARPAADGWELEGFSPFVSGWGRIDVVHTAARTDDGRLVWALVDARESGTLAVERLRLVALDATATVRADFRGHTVSHERVTGVDAVPAAGPPPVEVLRFHASFALGVARRCCRLLGETPLGGELERCRAALDRLDPRTIERDRAAAGELALRCAAALAVTVGSRSLLLAEHGQRLAREALFALVYALRPGSRSELLAGLGALPAEASNAASSSSGIE